MKEKSWEYVGKTVEEATQTAIEELGLERDDVFVEVLEEPQKGFLGIGGKEARIKVELIGEWEVVGKKPEDFPPPPHESGPEDYETPSYVRKEDPKSTYKPREEKEFPPSENKDKSVEMIKGILEIFEIDAMVEGREREDSIVVDIWGDDVAILIGKGGFTLDALQYIVNVSCRRTGDVSKKIIVDIEGYRKRRKAKLEKQAEQMASKSVSQQKSIELPPMSSSERKIIHMALRQFDGVWTESTGDGADRRIVIHPGSEN
jgi:spoIIIJ-associated protein